MQLLDVLLTFVHLAIIIFNLFGWISKSTRKFHFISILLTAGSWFVLGIWFGIGYCPITDWQWKVKAQMGENNLPSNFIEYFAEKITGYDFSPQLVNVIIAVFFALAALLSVYMNFVRPRFSSKSGHS